MDEDDESEDDEDEDDEDGDDNGDHEEEVDMYGPKWWPRDALTDVQLDYVFAELRHLANKWDERTGIHVRASSVCHLCLHMLMYNVSRPVLYPECTSPHRSYRLL